MGKFRSHRTLIGPWIVTADGFPNPQHRRLRLRVDGVIKEDDTTGNMIFNISECIAALSHGMILLSGQIIATGTPTARDSPGPRQNI